MVRVRTYRKQKPQKLVEQFLRSSRVRCSTPEQAFGRCYNIAEDLVKYLKKRKIEARLVTVKGFRGRLGKGAVLRWEITPRKHFNHAVVLVDDTVIDLTGSQYGYEYGNTTYSLDTLKKRWEWIAGHEERL